MFVDDLYSTSTEMGLTANMGRQLREMIEEVTSRVEELEASQTISPLKTNSVAVLPLLKTI